MNAQGEWPAAFAEIIAPLSLAALRTLLQQRKPCHVVGHAPDRYAGLANWDGLMDALRSGEVPARKLRLSQRSKILPGAFYRDGNRLRVEALEAVMRSGGSVIVEAIQPHHAALGPLCAALAEQLGERVTAGMIATTGSGGALPSHHDGEDLLILQVEGSKRWLIEHDPAPDPIPYLNPLKTPRTAAPILMDLTLNAGDFLFLPAGYRHRCETVADRSLHIGIFIWPLTVARALDLLVRELADDPAARAPLRGNDDDAAVTETLRRALSDRVDRFSLSALRQMHQTQKLNGE